MFFYFLCFILTFAQSESQSLTEALNFYKKRQARNYSKIQQSSLYFSTDDRNYIDRKTEWMWSVRYGENAWKLTDGIACAYRKEERFPYVMWDNYNEPIKMPHRARYPNEGCTGDIYLCGNGLFGESNSMEACSIDGVWTYQKRPLGPDGATIIYPFYTYEDLENECTLECGRQGYNNYRIEVKQDRIRKIDKYTTVKDKLYRCWCSMFQSDSPFKARFECDRMNVNMDTKRRTNDIRAKRFYCPKGYEHAIRRDNNHVVCAECPIGYYQDEKNLVDMLAVDTRDEDGNCENCYDPEVETPGPSNIYGASFKPLKNYWAKNVFADRCKICPKGYYQDETAQASCKKCPGGITTSSWKNTKVTDCDTEKICGSGSELEKHTLSNMQTSILRSGSGKREIYILDSNTHETEFYNYNYNYNSGNKIQAYTSWYDPTKTSTNNDDIDWRRNAHKHGTQYVLHGESNTHTCQQCQPGTYAEMAPLPYDTGTQIPAGRYYNFIQTIRQYTSKSFSKGTACFIEAKRKCFRRFRYFRDGGMTSSVHSCRTSNELEYCKQIQVICKQCPVGKTGNGWHCEDPFNECAADKITVINDAGSAQCQKCPAGTFTFPVDNNWIVPTLSNTLDTSVDVKYLEYSLTTASPMNYTSWTSVNKDSVNKDERYLDWLNVYDYMNSSSMDLTYVRWLKRTPQSGLEHYYLHWLKSQTNAVNHAEYSKLPSTMCFGCPNGKTNNDGGTGLDSCNIAVECPSGKISHGGVCVDAPECPSGQFVDDDGNWRPCAAGKYKKAGDTPCLECPRGKYQNEIGQIFCFSCSEGQYQDQLGQVNCTICPVGTHSVPDKTECAECGYSAFSAAGAASCTSCPTGFYGIDAANYFDMPTTYGQSNAFQTEKRDDIGITLRGQLAVTTCRECEPGKTTDSSTRGLLPSCGHHNSKTVMCACTDTVVCKANHTCDTTRGCVHKDNFIPPPKWKDIKTKFLEDEEGWYYYGEWYINKRVWVEYWGKYQSWKNTIDKLNWIKSTHYCHECPLHTYTNPSQNVNIDGTIIQVPVGGDCIRCPAGYYTSETGQTGCESCPVGKFGEYIGNKNKCVDCPRGQYQESVGQTECVVCPSGKKGGSKGSSSATECEDCPTGKYSVSTTECTSCSPGKTTTSKGSTICSDCSVGFYSLSGSGCLTCPHGQFQDVEGQSSCKTCPAGKNTHYTSFDTLVYFTDYMGFIECIDCRIGQFSATGYTRCIPCFIGTYQNAEGQDHCISCPTGKYETEEGQTQCKNCSNTYYKSDQEYSTYQDEMGQINCKSCPIGKYESEEGQNSCKTCPNGFTTTQFGSMNCSMCEPGFKGIGGDCDACNNAEYQDEHGQTECKLCADGRFAPTTEILAHTECQKCPSGYYGFSKFLSTMEIKFINVGDDKGYGYCSNPDLKNRNACQTGNYTWKIYRKCQDIPGNIIWETTIRSKYECRDAWLNFVTTDEIVVTNDEKQYWTENNKISLLSDKYEPICGYFKGIKCDEHEISCSEGQVWLYPPKIYWNTKSIMTNTAQQTNSEHANTEYNRLNTKVAACKVNINSTKMPSYLIDKNGIQCHQCPSGQFSTKEGHIKYGDTFRCRYCLDQDICTRCDWGRYSRPDRIFGETTYEKYMEDNYGLDITQWPPEEQYYCSTCPAGWDSTARTFTWKQGTEYELGASEGCQLCVPGTYSRFVETNEYEHDLGKFGRYKGHSGYIITDGQSNDATSANDYVMERRKEDYFLNKGILLQHKGCSRCDGEGEYQDEFGQSSCKTCSDAGLEDTPLDEVLAHLKEFIECVPDGEPGVGTPLDTSPDGYDCYRTNNVHSGLFNAWNENILINAHGMKWIKCRNATSALAPYWRTTNWHGDIGTGAGAQSNLNVWDEYYDKDTHSSGYKKDVYAHKLTKPRPAQILLEAARQKNKLELASASPTEEDICSLSYMYSDSRIENMTKEELLDAMKEVSSVLLRRGTTTDILPYDVPMFSVKNLYNAQGTCSEGGICNNIDVESFTCSDTGIGGQTIPVTGLTSDKLAALFTCGDPMANVCQNSALNLTTWECLNVDVVTDNTPPVITLNGENPKDVEAGTTYTDAGAMCFDVVDGNLSSSIITQGTVDTFTQGTYTITYNCADSSGNQALEVVRTVPVSDTTIPVIKLVGNADITLEAGGDGYVDDGAMCSDSLEGDITSTIVTQNTVDIFVLGTYTITYNCADSSGNDALEVVRSVKVVDTTPPVLVLLGNADITLEVGTTYTDAGAVCLDVVDGDLTSTIVTQNTVDIFVLGEYEVTYNCADSSGNDAVEVVRTVNVN